MARTGERQPSRSYVRTWSSVRTFGMFFRPRVDLVPDVAAAHHAVLAPEHRDRTVGDPPLRQRRLATDVVVTVVEQPEVFRMLRGDLVVDGGRAHDAAQATLDPATQTEQA